MGRNSSLMKTEELGVVPDRQHGSSQEGQDSFPLADKMQDAGSGIHTQHKGGSVAARKAFQPPWELLAVDNKSHMRTMQHFSKKKKGIGSSIQALLLIIMPLTSSREEKCTRKKRTPARVLLGTRRLG